MGFGANEILAREDLEADAGRRGGGFELGALDDPIAEHVVGWVLRMEFHSASVRCLHQRLEEEEALIDIEEIETPSPFFAGEGEAIQFRIETAEGEAKATFSAGGTMAGSGVAALFGEGGLDIVFERDGRRFREWADVNGDGLGEPLPGDFEMGFTREAGDESSLVDVEEVWIGGSPSDMGGHVDGVLGMVGQHDELLCEVRRSEVDGVWIDSEGGVGWALSAEEWGAHTCDEKQHERGV